MRHSSRGTWSYFGRIEWQENPGNNNWLPSSTHGLQIYFCLLLSHVIFEKTAILSKKLQKKQFQLEKASPCASSQKTQLDFIWDATLGEFSTNFRRIYENTRCLFLMQMSRKTLEISKNVSTTGCTILKLFIRPARKLLPDQVVPGSRCMMSSAISKKRIEAKKDKNYGFNRVPLEDGLVK